MAPEYAKAATELAAEKSEILLAKVDATKETDLAENYDVRGYPTLKFFRNGKPIDYNGDRTAEGIIKWLKKKTGPPAQDLTTAEDAAKFRDSQEVVVVGYFPDKDSANAKLYLEVAAENDAIPFALITDKSVAESLAITEDGERVVLFKKFDENRNDFDGEYSVDNLKLFIAANSLPLAVEFNHDVSEILKTKLFQKFSSISSMYRLQRKFLAVKSNHIYFYSSVKKMMIMRKKLKPIVQLPNHIKEKFFSSY